MNEAIDFHEYVMENYYTTYGNFKVYKKRQSMASGIIDIDTFTIEEIYNQYKNKHEYK